MSTLPLDGIKVVEFCHTVMGPSCGLLLADFGADVVKVEPTEGDRTRRIRGFAAGFFSYLNRNKRSLAIDFKSERGKQIVYDLIERADVLVENFAPKTLERLGFGPDELMRRNPRLIYCSLKGFLSGPYESRPALDEVVQYMTGLSYMTGPPGRPLRAGASVVDLTGGIFGVIAILNALRQRDRSGNGSYVKSALFESSVFLVAQHMAGEAMTGEPVPPMPVRKSAWGIYETFETADAKQVFIGITTDHHWKRWCEALSREDLMADPEFKTNEDRVAAHARLAPIVAGIVRSHTFAEIAELCERIDVPFSPVATPSDLFDDPQVNAHGRMLETVMTNGNRTKLPCLPIEIDRKHFDLRRQPPQLGEHSTEVLQELGLGNDEIMFLREEGIIAGTKGE